MSLLLKLSIALLAMVLHVAALNAATNDDKPAPDSDHQITEQIRDALYRNPSLASNDISVQTKDGVVYLHGLVDTNVQRVAVEEIVKGFAGVKRVVDSLELRNDVR